MNNPSEIPASAESLSGPAGPIPANEYERFLAALTEPMRAECRAQLAGSGFAANHPLFKALADFYEKTGVKQEAATQEPARDFVQEAALHAGLAQQLLSDFQKIPKAILGQIEPQLLGVLSAFNGPLERLEITSTHLQRNVEALPVLVLGSRAPTCPPFKKWRNKVKWWLRQLPRQFLWAFSDHMTWIVPAVICASLAFAATVTVLAVGATHLSRSYEEAYQQRLAHLEADSAQNTVALNRLLSAGIVLGVERGHEPNTYFLILQGAHKAAQPVNSPEGLAVEVWL